MPGPNYLMPANAAITGPTWQPQQYSQPYQQPIQFNQPQPQNYQNTPVMSIAPVSGESNAAQFPVAVGTELWLVDKAAHKIYIKTNSANPSEMQEIDYTFVVKQQNQNEPVSRSEFEDMKAMMGQMMAMLQQSQQSVTVEQNTQPQQPRRNSEWKKRGNRNDQPDGNPANNG